MINKEVDYPLSTEKIYPGAALLTPVWALYHRKYLLALLSIIPYITIIASIMALIYGGRWAWDSGRYETEFFFNESKTKWNVSSLLIALIILMILLYL